MANVAQPGLSSVALPSDRDLDAYPWLAGLLVSGHIPLIQAFLPWCFFKDIYQSLFSLHAHRLHVFACLILHVHWVFWMCWNLLLFLFLIPSKSSFQKTVSYLQLRRPFQPCCWWADTFHLCTVLLKEESRREQRKGRNSCFLPFVNIQQRYLL